MANSDKNLWTKEFKNSTLLGVFMLAASLVINYKAGMFALERVSRPVTDIILSNIRTIDVDWIIIWGAVLMIFFVFFVLLYQPRRIPFVLKSLAVFIVIRALFISMTHIGPFTPQADLDTFHFLHFLGIGTAGDLFFSGHTGMPFLLALIFWDDKMLRTIFMTCSIIFAISVLLGHLHYSIDVFAAFFITYTIFQICQYLFAKDWQISYTK